MDTKTLTLTPTEQLLILAALHTVSPTGGGSAQYTLARKLGEIFTGLDADALQNRIQHFSQVVANEQAESEGDDFNSVASAHRY